MGLIDSFAVNNLASKISIFVHVLSMEGWIHLFVIIIFHLIVYELLSEFFGDVLNSLLCYMWCVSPLSHLDNLWVLAGGLGHSAREQWQGPQFFVATWGAKEDSYASSFKEMIVMMGGNSSDLQWLWGLFCSDFFLNSILCKTLHRVNSPFFCQNAE